LLSFFALYPALILLMVSSHSDFLETDLEIRNDLIKNARLVSSRIDVWLCNRANAVGNLAELAVTLTPVQMQPRLAQTQNSDTNFIHIGLLNMKAVTTAFSPPVDELLQSNIGRTFVYRSFIPRLKQTLRPMLSEVVMGAIGRPTPMVMMLAPVVKANEYEGYVSGALSLDALKEFLDRNSQGGTMLYALLDTNGNVILANHKDLKIMEHFVRNSGRVHRIDGAISQWIPKLPPNTPISEQWRSSVYAVETPVGGLSEWRLILEQPVAPFQTKLYSRYTDQLALLFVLLFTALALAEFLSCKVVSRTLQLTLFTKTLPKNLSIGVEPIWPKSNLTEHHNLIERFKEMAATLSEQFSTNKELTATLERRIAARTAELTASEEKYRLLINNSHDIIYTLNQHGVFTFVSPAWTSLLGHSVGQVDGHSFREFVHPDDIPICNAALIRMFETGQQQINIEYRLRHLDQSWRWHSSNALPMKDEAGNVIGLEGTSKDITVQKGLEDTVRQMAFYDSLTKLPNRRLLVDRLSQVMAASKRSSSYAALMFLDLDNFKPLNDTHGHCVGDQLLIEVGNRLSASVREIDTVARFGGDEFVVLLCDLGTTEPAAQAQVVAEKIRSSLADPYLLTVQQAGSADKIIEHHCTVSIGVVIFVNHELSQSDVLKWADDAMYQAKVAGRDRIRFHEMPPARGMTVG
jgi:diguanylate cyclase (GGDEF)-like protein/PAS domain S-box-containing protein